MAIVLTDLQDGEVEVLGGSLLYGTPYDYVECMEGAEGASEPPNS